MSERQREQPACAPAAQQTLLLVDDEANILSSLRRLLRKDGYRLLCAGSGEEGLAILREQPVDVILSDQRMPGMSGVEFLRQAKTLRPDTVRLVLSGYTELQTITTAINEGAIFKFLTKPWDDDRLRAIIAEACHFKGLSDENLRLSLQLQQANERLEQMLAEKQGQILRDRHALEVLHEVLQCLPQPLLGVDDAGMVASLNEAGARLFGCGDGWLGNALQAVCPPPVCAALAEAARTGGAALGLGGRPYRVRAHRLGVASQARGWLYVFFAPERP